MIIIIIMGHGCIWETEEQLQETGGVEERILRAEEDAGTLHIYI
jgi:peptide methionine sulfoxide reductase MsrA